ncbi:MAG: 16S rRNA (cytosine(1402)-N(4))-methyltransferase RsmH [Parcubacteria group bacterium]
MMHKPVLLKEVLEILNPKPGQIFIDGTVGAMGHTGTIAKNIGPKGKVLGIDWDKGSLDQLSKISPENVILAHGNYADMESIATSNGIKEADGVLLDLGFSSYHIEDTGRGFSFQKDEPLDMRYDISQSFTAAEVVNSYRVDQLGDVIKEYGEERYARLIAKAIIDARKEKRIITTKHLVEVIRSAVPGRYQRNKIHFATRTFQALRIEVNQELQNLKDGLHSAIRVLKPDGILAVISFHSLEDRIVKNFFRDCSGESALSIITKKPITASAEEIRYNPRSRSAKLRAASKI